jgi:chemotaxis signal transduction protein
MDRIVINRNGELAVIAARPFPEERQEGYLHRILESEPQFVAPLDNETGELLPIVVVASKLKLPSGDELDLLLLDSRGIFTLCELKRGRVVRKTVGQILDYAAQLAEMSWDDLQKQIDQARQRLREQIEQAGGEWDEESFTDDALRDQLKSPRLVIVGWQIEEDTLRIVRWLQQQGINIECYGFSYFSAENFEVFVPQNLTPYIGEEERPPRSGDIRRKAFWEDMLRRLGDKVPNKRTPPTTPWVSFGIGMVGAWISWYGSPSRLRVQLLIDKRKRQDLISHVRDDAFLRELKEETGETWERRETEARLRFQTERDAGTSVWEAPEEVRNWGVDTLVKLYNFAVRYLREGAVVEEE